MGVKELYESPTYRWQQYDVITTYYWNKYEVKTVYNDTLISTGGSTDEVHQYLGDWKDHFSITIHTQYNVNSETGQFTYGDSGRKNLFYNFSSGGESYSGTFYFIGGDVENNDARSTQIRVCSYGSVHIEDLSDVYCVFAVEDVCRADYDQSAGSLVQQNIASTASSAYPANGIDDDDYWYIRQSKVDRVRGNNLLGTVTSKNETQYPENGYSGGYWYVRTS